MGSPWSAGIRWATVAALTVVMLALGGAAHAAKPLTLSVSGASLGVKFPDGSSRIFSREEPASDLPSGTEVEALAGTAQIAAAGLQLSMPARSCVRVSLMDRPGVVRLTAVSETCVITIGDTTLTFEAGEVAEVSVDPQTGQINVTAIEGNIHVESAGKATELAAGESMTVTMPATRAGAASGEAEPLLDDEEPPSPERPEASEFAP